MWQPLIEELEELGVMPQRKKSRGQKPKPQPWLVETPSGLKQPGDLVAAEAYFNHSYNSSRTSFRMSRHWEPILKPKMLWRAENGPQSENRRLLYKNRIVDHLGKSEYITNLNSSAMKGDDFLMKTIENHHFQSFSLLKGRKFRRCTVMIDR